MTITINGEIVHDDDLWLYNYLAITAFTPSMLRQAIKDNPVGETLELEINSVGGDMFAGFEMYSVLRAAECHTVAKVQSMAASAASTMMCGCDEVQMSPVAQVMIHLPMIDVRGNQDDMVHKAATLESFTQSILNGYELRCGQKTTRAELERMMHEETWITAQQAVDMGLADSIIGAEDSALTGNIYVNAMSASLRRIVNGAGGVHNRDVLLARYEQLVRSGAEPAPGHPVEDAAPGSSISDDWQAKARLEIEKNRF